MGDFTEAESSAEAGTVPCSIPGGVFYFYICGPGGVYKKVPVAFNGVEGDCGGGPGGFWAVVGGGGGGGSIDPRGVSVKSDCDECATERLKALLNCVVGFIPGVGCPKGIYDCVNDLSSGGLTWESGLK